MFHRAFLLVLIFGNFLSPVSSQVPDRPHATIYFVRSGSYIGSACVTDITLPNQRSFNLSLGSIVEYTVYSQGIIAVTREISCPATQSTVASRRSDQVSLDITSGTEYYVEVSAGKFRVVPKDDVQKQLDKIKSVMVHAENLDFPIDKASIAANDPNKGAGQCTCFLISASAYVVTNAHCVKDGKEFKVRTTMNGVEREVGATLVASDPSNDLALLKLDGTDIQWPDPPFAIRSKGVEQAERILALGYPYADVMGSEVKVTEGVISARSGVGGDISKFQISAPINPGNSGGPLIDEQGNLIGVLYAKSGMAEGAGYAIKASYLETFLSNIDDLDPPVLTNTIEATSTAQVVSAWRNYVWILSSK